MLNIYKASAGSGKTYTLAMEYIKLLLGTKNPETGEYRLNKSPRKAHRNILAITFTVKATEEMKQRIIHELAVLAEMEPGWDEKSDYLGELMKFFKCSEQDLKDAAAVALNSMLIDFNYFSVSTIDSFFQTVLRTFAREAELTGNYEVELDDDTAISFGMSRMLAWIENDARTKEEAVEMRRLKNWLLSYMNTMINDGKAFNIFNKASMMHKNIVGFISSIKGEQFALNYKRMMDYLRDTERIGLFAEALRDKRRTIESAVKESATRAVEYIDVNMLAERKLVNRNLYNLLVKCTATPPKDPGKTAGNVLADPMAAFTAAGKKLYSGGEPMLQGLVADALKRLMTFVDKVKEIDAISRNLYMLGLLGTVFDKIEEFRQENEVILLSDTTALLREIIGDDDAPFVYERVGQWFNHYLIDEFQDTSLMQWQNLRPLVGESLSTSNDNLIIGDEKQCIYRFRDSDPTLLQNIDVEFPDDTNFIKADLAGNTNYRSSRDVVTFNNSLFAALALDESLGGLYGNVVQPVSKKHIGHRGHVRVNLLESKSEPDFLNDSLDLLMKDIKSQLDAGYRGGDIAVLVRNNKQGAAVISRLLESACEMGYEGLRVASDDSLQIDSVSTVRLIVSVLRVIAADNLPAEGRRVSARKVAELVNRFECGMADGTDGGEALINALYSAEDVTDKALDAYKMSRVNLMSVVERIVSRYLSPDLLQRDNLFISAFQDLVTEFTGRGTCDIRSFLKWWDESGHETKVACAADPDAVKVMTIHKSKGLEFKCCHVPFVNMKMPRLSDQEWFEPSGLDDIDSSLVPPMLPIKPDSWMEKSSYADRYRELCSESIIDELNVMYVALTRATENLTVNVREDTPAGEMVVSAIGNADDTFLHRRFDELKAARAGGDIGYPFVEGGLKLETAAETGARYVEVGSPVKPEKKEEETKKRTALDAGEVQPMPPYSSSDRDDLWACSRLDDLRYVSRAASRGLLIHGILGDLRAVSDLPVVIRKMRLQGRIGDEHAAELERYLSRRLTDADVARWFDGFERVVAERSILWVDSAKNEQMRRRPDRIVWLADGSVEIVDYKTGQEDAASHRNQVRGYMDRLRELGYENVRGYLWYLDLEKVVEVSAGQ